jgi:hypothetical protein
MTMFSHLDTFEPCLHRQGRPCPHDHLHEKFNTTIQRARFDAAYRLVHVDSWVTAEGQRIPITSMDDSHLANTILFLRRRLATPEQRMLAALSLPHPNMNGDMAQLAMESEWDRLTHEMTESIAGIPAFMALVVEHTRRLIASRRARLRRPVPTNSF